MVKNFRIRELGNREKKIKRNKLAINIQEGRFKRILFLPTYIYLAVMVIFPLFFTLIISFSNFSLGQPFSFNGVENYWSLFKCGNFWLVVGNTFIITISAVSIQMILGIIIGVLLFQKLPLFGFFRIIIFIPMMLAPLVVSYFWKFLLDPSIGLINYFWTLLGGENISWFTSPILSKVAVIIVDTMQWTPLIVLLTLAGLGTIPENLVEAANLEKASIMMKFRHIYLPSLRMPLLLGLLLRTIDCLKLFDVPYILTGGGPGDYSTTITLLGYREAFKFFQLGKASAIAWIILIIASVVATILVNKIMPKKKVEKVHMGL